MLCRRPDAAHPLSIRPPGQVLTGVLDAWRLVGAVFRQFQELRGDLLAVLRCPRKTAGSVRPIICKVLGGVDRFESVSEGGKMDHSEESVRQLVVSRGDGAVDLELPDHARFSRGGLTCQEWRAR